MRTSRLFFTQVVLASLLTLAPLVGHAAETPKSVISRGSCSDKISSDVLFFYKNGYAIQQIRLAHNLGDGDQMGLVLTNGC